MSTPTPSRLLSGNITGAGRSALVVGGGRGLGRAIALQLAATGYRIALAARTQSEIEQVAEEIAVRGGHALALSADATQPDAVSRLAERVLAEYGRIDVLVNCAGEALIRPTLENTPADFQRIIASNLTSVFLTCRAIMPQMMRQREGHIVNIASKVGRDGAVNVAAYTAAKAGVIGFSKALGLELKPYNVKVSVICPSPMDTKMRWDATPDFDLAKTIRPESVAQLVQLLVTNPDMTIDELFPSSIRL
jgi:NAD(P)-dependent dehydrogenase (short-subunit alcohol dehydrogenase family)